MARLFRFGPFELDVRAGELRKHGIRIKLREQPVRILLMLLEQPGEVVLREDIRQRLWPNNTIVEFDHGINAAIQKLRDALGESAGTPRYVETVARRGYRFLGEVEPVGEPVAEPAPESEPERDVVSHYQITGKLGEGGMGVVYRALDLKLGRQVAVKFLPGEAGELPESILRRFEREARAASALNHPNICTIYGLEDFDGQPAIVMELVEGETLAARLAKGRMLREEALRVALQISGALVEAHSKGITHRDLKPANIMLTKSGAKVLDFGLAKIERPMTGSPAGEDAETLTERGALVGTLQYMSPEQLEGAEADPRSDLFSFGLVLYEMITGERAFEGSSRASVIAAILEREPKAFEPEWLNRVVRACLAKDPGDRFQTARDLQRALEWGEAAGSAAPVGPPSRTWIPWAAAATCAALAFLAGLRVGPGLASVQNREFSIVPPAGTKLVPPGDDVPQISPDGSWVLFETTDGLWVQRLDSIQARLLPGSKDHTNPPFWSSDSKSVIFPVNPALVRVRVPDGPPEEIAKWPHPSRGGTVSDQGTILFSADNGGLQTVAASGGEMKHADMPGSTGSWDTRAQFLPGSEDFLFLRRAEDPEQNQIYLAQLRAGKGINLVPLMKNRTAVSYTPAGGGRIFFVRNDNLYAQKLNLKHRKLEGAAELIQEHVASAGGEEDAAFSVSRTGTVVWRPGVAALSRVTIFDRRGQEIGAAGPWLAIDSLALSPDEQRLTAHGSSSWLVSPGQSASLSLGPVKWRWFPDGSRLLGQDDDLLLMERSIEGSNEPHELRRVGGYLQDISPDGKYILLFSLGSRLGMWVASLDGDTQDKKALAPSGEMAFSPSFSPDGRWIVYTVRGKEGVFSGMIFVQPFPGPGFRTQIFGARGFPIWRKDGKEIVIVDQRGVWSVRVESAGGGLRFGSPELLFTGLRWPVGAVARSSLLAVSRDGSRIYFPQAVEQPNPNVIYVRMGWASK